MKKSLLCASVLGVSSLFQLTAHADMFGSYLFCVNEKDSNDWKWAPKSPDGVKGYENNATSPALRGTWINGIGAINPFVQSVLDVNHTFSDSKDAENFCTELKNVCTKAFGPNFTQVGVSSWAIPSSIWGQISVKYGAKDEKGNVIEGEGNSSVCPNWKFKTFPNNGGANFSFYGSVR